MQGPAGPFLFDAFCVNSGHERPGLAALNFVSFMESGLAAGQRLAIRWHYDTGEVPMLSPSVVARIPAGSILFVDASDLLSKNGVALDEHGHILIQYARKWGPQSLLLSSPELLTILNASKPLIVVLNDERCAVNWPAGKTHHVLYRTAWCRTYHEEWLRQTWTHTRFVPYGVQWPAVWNASSGSYYLSPAKLSTLRAGASKRADTRELLFSFRGHWSQAKVDRMALRRAMYDGGIFAALADLGDRAMAQAPPPAVGTARVVFDMPGDGDSYQTSEWSYEELLRSSIFALSPGGDFWETYRTWEAIESGSIPVVHDYRGNYGGCVEPAVHLRAMAPNAILFVRDWAQLPSLLESEMANLSRVVWRQAELARWFRGTKRDAFIELAESSLAMRTACEQWHAPTVCIPTPLGPRRIAQEHAELARSWRRPQSMPPVGTPAAAGMYVKAKAFVGAEGSFCKESEHDDFAERCLTRACLPPLLARVDCESLECAQPASSRL